MKAIRALAVALAVVALIPSIGVAQDRGFDDSWFWGVKAGATFMSAPSKANLTSPMAGVEWMITRTHGGLYISLDQSFFKQYGAIDDSVSSTDTVPRAVNLQNMRRLTIALMGFPGDNPRFHPYAGLGITYNQVATVSPVGTYNSADQAALAQAIITQAKAVFAPVVMAGGQMKTSMGSLFIQGMVWPSNSQFFLFNSRGFNASLEAGIRFNVANAIDSDH